MQIPSLNGAGRRVREHPILLQLTLLAVVILATWIPRGLALDRFVTPDEDFWLYRSANFYYGLTHLDFASTYQKEHPGVMAMWAGTAGFMMRFPGYRGSGLGQVNAHQLQSYLIEKTKISPLEILTAGRAILVAANTLILALSFWVARRTLGLWPAFAGFLLLAFDPFHLALTRILHLDGLLTDLLLLSLLEFLSYLQEGKMHYLLASGAAAGFSWLTKSPGFVLLPVIGLVALLDLWRRTLPWKGEGLSDFARRPDGDSLLRKVTSKCWPLALWGFAGVLVFISFWPAMWKEPVYVLSKVFGEALGYAEAGHASPVFFNGRLTEDGNLGLSFFYFYPLIYLWRSTPIVLIGLALAFAGFLRKEIPFHRDAPRQAALSLLLMAAAFTFLITLSGKKFDRYLIPAFAPLDLLAGMGWVWLAAKWRERLAATRFTWLATAVVALAVAGQMASALPTFPYYFSYYNPLMGGSRKAAEVMQIGWGEGLDQAANYLDQKPDAENLKVISWYSTSSFAYLSNTQARFMGPKGDWTEEDWKLFNTSDYAIVYIQQWQREMPAEVLARLEGMAPEHSVWINGIEYVRIYKIQ